MIQSVLLQKREIFSQTGLRAERTPTKHNPNICGVMDNF
jgi:hypothetical protein